MTCTYNHLLPHECRDKVVFTGITLLFIKQNTMQNVPTKSLMCFVLQWFKSNNYTMWKFDTTSDGGLNSDWWIVSNTFTNDFAEQIENVLKGTSFNAKIHGDIRHGPLYCSNPRLFQPVSRQAGLFIYYQVAGSQYIPNKL